MTPQEYVEEVLTLVESIPEGRVMSYGAIADVLSERSGRNSPRQVGRIMSLHGGAVPWYRVCSGGGRLPPGHEARAKALLLAEGVPMRGDRVLMASASWLPAM